MCTQVVNAPQLSGETFDVVCIKSLFSILAKQSPRCNRIRGIQIYEVPTFHFYQGVLKISGNKAGFGERLGATDKFVP